MTNLEIDNYSLQLEIPVRNMNKGATVPIKDILDIYPNPNGLNLVDIGSGSSEKTTILQEKGFNITSVDILPEAINIAQNSGFDGRLIDVTSFVSEDQSRQLNEMVGAYDVVLLQGLLVNLVENNGDPKWKKGLDACHMMLKPGGHMFGAVVIRQDEIDMFKYNLPESFDYKEHSKISNRRYQQNEKLGLPWGTVMVGKPGKKKYLEWEDKNSLITLESEGQLERLVHHVDYIDLLQTLSKIKDSGFSWKTSLFTSRDLGRYYVGIVFCLNKMADFDNR